MNAVMNITRDCDGKWHPSAQDLALRHSSMFNETIEKGKTTPAVTEKFSSYAKRKLISLIVSRGKNIDVTNINYNFFFSTRKAY